MVNAWKVILATVIIFGAGVMTGGLLVKLTRPSTAPAPAPVPMRLEMIHRLTRELDLTSEQRMQIDQILRESQERNKILWELQEPDRREELKKVHEDMNAVLTPPQRQRFEALFRERQRQMQQKPPLNNFRPNQPPRGPLPESSEGFRPNGGPRGPQFNRPRSNVPSLETPREPPPPARP